MIKSGLLGIIAKAAVLVFVRRISPLPHKFVDFQIYAADFIFICLLWNL